MVVLGAVAWVTTPAALRRENDFTWGPMAEVATIFAGIFATMMPALVVRTVAGRKVWLCIKGVLRLVNVHMRLRHKARHHLWDNDAGPGGALQWRLQWSERCMSGSPGDSDI